jgi:hypothetical protein
VIGTSAKAVLIPSAADNAQPDRRSSAASSRSTRCRWPMPAVAALPRSWAEEGVPVVGEFE